MSTTDNVALSLAEFGTGLFEQREYWRKSPVAGMPTTKYELNLHEGKSNEVYPDLVQRG